MVKLLDEDDMYLQRARLEQRWRPSHENVHLLIPKIFTAREIDAKHCASCSGLKGVNEDYPQSSRNSCCGWGMQNNNKTKLIG